MQDGLVLVTGGSGFIASWCIAGLIQRGFRVRATIRSPAREREVREEQGVFDDRLSFAIAELGSDAGWDAAVAGCDYVLHVASPLGGGSDRGRLPDYLGPAREGTLRVLRAAVAAKVKRVVYTSAAAAARPPLGSGRISTEETWADPQDPQFDAYRVSKILAERAAWDFMRDFGGPTEFSAILPGAVFGPLLGKRQAGSVEIIDGLLRGEPAAVPKLGFWIVDVRDLADLHIRAMLSPSAAGQRFIASGGFVWLGEIAGILRSGLGSRADRVPVRKLPTFVVRILAPFSPKAKAAAPLIGKRFEQSSEKARRVLGFSPRLVAETILDCARSLPDQVPAR